MRAGEYRPMGSLDRMPGHEPGQSASQKKMWWAIFRRN